MPFQVFRRHQRKLLALLAIMAMFAFVVADSLPRLFSNYAAPPIADRVVVSLAGRDVRRSDLERLRLQRGRANYVLSQLAMRVGGQAFYPYFDEQPFGPTDDRAMVDALILQRKADELGLPRSPELARTWIFEQARTRHELFRNLQPTLPAFDPRDLAVQLQFVFNQAFGNELTETAFLTDVADQVRILQALELLSQPVVTPLDAFQVYSDQQVEVVARYVGLPVADSLDEVPEPTESELRTFFDAHDETVPDPSSGTVGFRAPERAKIEYIALGLNAIDLIREQVRSEPIAEEIRAAEGFEEEVLAAFAEELAGREQSISTLPLPVNPFTDPGDGEGVALSYPIEFERRYVAEQVELLVEERTRDRIEELFDPVRRAMNDFSYGIEEDFDAIRTGLEPGVDREALPDLEEEFLSSEPGAELIRALGVAAGSDEGIAFVRIGLTPTLATPDTFQELLAPDGIPPEWRDYLTLARLDWADAPYELLRKVQRLTEASEGIDRPAVINPTDTEGFAEIMFADDSPLFDPREFTDALGRRFLVWKTMALPERSRSFEETPEGVVASVWRREQARELARKAAEALAERVRNEMGPETSASVALDQIAIENGLTVGTTGARRRADTLAAYAPIKAGEEFRDAMFRLAPDGEDAAVVAPDRPRQTYYVLALSRRTDGSLGGSLADQGTGLDYGNALTTLQFYRSEADREAMQARAESVMEYLRAQAGLPEDWTPPEPDRG
ncbi:hypothetical protein [Tautonia sociabilis]|uniref:PpiC domain-containing protein n=1 Tax=Tautonia sociabilis TaxID=2080755 RepID=A0A432MQU7_9BACT|nr:hypothetical protein [Tautonia sociabilis]RUL89740.1 hypothetical protein TsocGM_00825 [Tautonia sociabilis]